jgi:glycosyltransferase involved in cell wall biosynthesis
MQLTLSYIIVTKNRLSFLKILFDHLLPHLHADEEIVVVDGNSTDGSKEYLEARYKEGNIHQFISETDKNQAHGWNKAMLMAKGIIIKKIIDDDVFCYPAIRKCKNFMLSNPAIDVVISNDLSSKSDDYKNIQKSSRLPQFKKWKNGENPSFTFGDVHMLIRKSSLSYIGLYNTDFIMMDWEYSLRISYLKANIAYYTGYNALSVGHSLTVSFAKDHKLFIEQGKKAAAFYGYHGYDNSDISVWSKIKIYLGNMLYKLNPPNTISHAPIDKIDNIYLYYNNHLLALHNADDYQFIL